MAAWTIELQSQYNPSDSNPDTTPSLPHPSSVLCAAGSHTKPFHHATIDQELGGPHTSQEPGGMLQGTPGSESESERTDDHISSCFV